MNRAFLVGEYARFLTAAGRAPNTVMTRRRQLERLARTLDPLTCTEDDLLDFLTAHEWKPATRAAERAGLLVLFDWLHAAGHRGDNPAERLPAVRVPPPMPRPAPEDAVAQAREGAANPHERLMVDLAARAGLRRSEIATLRFSDLIHDGNGDALRVTGKGGRTRVVPIAPDLAEQIRARRVDHVFPGRHPGQHVSPNWVGEVLSRLLGPGYSGHTLRHRFATRAYAGRRDLLAVQRLLGHSSPATTQVYVAIPMDDMRAAAYDAQ